MLAHNAFNTPRKRNDEGGVDRQPARIADRSVPVTAVSRFGVMLFLGVQEHIRPE